MSSFFFFTGWVGGCFKGGLGFQLEKRGQFLSPPGGNRKKIFGNFESMMFLFQWWDPWTPSLEGPVDPVFSRQNCEESLDGYRFNAV